MKKIKRTAAFLLLSAVIASCRGNEKEPSTADNTKDRKIILAHWADNIIIPAFDDFQEVLDVMVDKSEAFTTSPSTTSLAEFRSAWADAYTEWQKTELYAFGPADKYTLRNFFNIYPADVDGIHANMADPSANLDLPAAYATQGFPALDYLLNGVGANDDAIVAAYTTDPDAQPRLDYLSR